MKTQTTKQIIESHAAEYLAATETATLKALFERDGVATKQRWNKAVAAVIEIGGSDYYALRGECRAATMEALRSSVTHEVTLIMDAKARCGKFAICDEDGDVIWYGRFFDDDRSFSYGDSTEQSACECATARKAIWLGTLAGKASILASDARRFNVEINMEWIPGATNPADRWTTESGFRKYSDTDLASLAHPIEQLATA